MSPKLPHLKSTHMTVNNEARGKQQHGQTTQYKPKTSVKSVPNTALI